MGRPILPCPHRLLLHPLQTRIVLTTSTTSAKSITTLPPSRHFTTIPKKLGAPVVVKTQVLLQKPLQKLLQKLLLQHQQQQFPTAANASVSPSPLAEQPRVNQVGIQYLSKQLHRKIFPGTRTDAFIKNKQKQEVLEIAQQHLQDNELLGKKTQITDPITIENFPDLVGKSLDEHFYNLGTIASEPYMTMAKEFFAQPSPPSQEQQQQQQQQSQQQAQESKNGIPPIPHQDKWVFQPGWTRYTENGEPEQVPYPLEDALVFDVECLYKINNHAVLATCASAKAWYGWVSPALLQVSERKKKMEKKKNNKQVDWNHLIPMNCEKQDKLIIGYNVSYDRARILEEYNIKKSRAFYLDGMALHVAISGICSRQRPQWQKYNKEKNRNKYNGQYEDEGGEEDESHLMDDDPLRITPAQFVEEDPWLLRGTPNSLANVAKFHCNIDMQKEDRELFSSEDPQVVVDNFNMLMNYCAHDVEATFKVTQKLFDEFLERVPHPVSFAALKNLGNLILPTTKKWVKYIESAESCYSANRDEVQNTLKKLSEDLVVYIKQNKPDLEPDHANDPWLSQLDWTLKKARLKKDGTPVKNNAYLTGYPEWYRELFKSSSKTEMNISLRTRITPLLLRLKWEGYPLFWVKSQGWCFKVPYSEELVAELKEKNYVQVRLTGDEIESTYDALNPAGQSYVLFKVPHPDGPTLRCTSVLSKRFLRFFDEGVLTSQYDYAAKILKLNNEASYWMGNRQRISDQFVVFNDDERKARFFKTKKENAEHLDMGIILPRLASMGTITRRATENTWLTASNAKKNKIGSELKTLIEAPKGYCFVGADVDSEELWIASLVGDSIFGIHGGSALGWMTLEGEKSQKTDLHSKTASILGISRNDAKVFNYGRIYGAGLKFATTLLKQFNPSLSEKEAEDTAKKLYASTKGKIRGSKSVKSNKFYSGGSESVMFNALEAIAQQPKPRTPVLGAQITEALTKRNLNKNTYMTSRVNWTIQSSGVDYLHLLIVSMDYLIERYGIDARLAITVHDELRYLVKEEDKYMASLLLQVSNVWTRGMFAYKMGLYELPQSCAFFSEVEVDHVLRKDPKDACITPSQPKPIPPGELTTIRELLKLCSLPVKRRRQPLAKGYIPSHSTISTLDRSLNSLRLQTNVLKKRRREKGEEEL